MEAFIGCILVISILTITAITKKPDLQLSPGISIFQGANGQGKSNFLESIYNLCFGRPFRNLKESDLVYRDAPYYYLRGSIYLQQRSYKVEVGYEIKKKKNYKSKW